MVLFWTAKKWNLICEFYSNNQTPLSCRLKRKKSSMIMSENCMKGFQHNKEVTVIHAYFLKYFRIKNQIILS